jgi:hypothetical protein
MKMPAHKRTIWAVFNLHPATVSRAWRWALIFSQVILVGYLVAVRFSPYARSFTTVTLLFAGLAMISNLFLLFASPFLIRSHGRLAMVGCCVAVAAIIFILL